MSAARSESSSDPREIVTTRYLHAPRELVFGVFTDAQNASKWWGPRGFTTTTHAQELRVGGEWRFTMHGPDGKDWPNKIAYREIVRNERLVYSHGDFEKVHFEVTVSFETEGQGTRITMRSLFPSAEACEAVKKFGAVEGGHQTLDRLTEELARAQKPGAFVIARTLAAPRELVFRCWTQAEHLAHWWGPKGLQLSVLKLELRPGGTFHYAMRAPGGFEMFGKFVYRVIQAPERLEYIVSFADAQGGMVRHPMAAGWPLEMLNTVTFREIAGRTTLLLVCEPYQASAEECRTFEANFESMEKGFGGTFEQLLAYLAKL